MSKIVNLENVCYSLCNNLRKEHDPISTGNYDLDELFHGFKVGDVSVIDGFPGEPLRDLIANLHVMVAKESRAHTLYYPASEGPEGLLFRILSVRAQVDRAQITPNVINDPANPLGIYDVATMLDSYLQISSNAVPCPSEIDTDLQFCHSQSPRLVIIDNFHFMRPFVSAENRAPFEPKEVVLSELKRIGKRHGAHFILLAPTAFPDVPPYAREMNYLEFFDDEEIQDIKKREDGAPYKVRLQRPHTPWTNNTEVNLIYAPRSGHMTFGQDE